MNFTTTFCLACLVVELRVLFHVLSPARLAKSCGVGSVLVSPYACILWCERVSTFAVGQAKERTSFDVLNVCHWLKVIWVYAVAHAAKVIQFFVIWYRPNEQNVGTPVGKNVAVEMSGEPIPVSVDVPTPKPAGSSLLYLGPKIGNAECTSRTDFATKLSFGFPAGFLPTEWVSAILAIFQVPPPCDFRILNGGAGFGVSGCQDGPLSRSLSPLGSVTEKGEWI